MNVQTYCELERPVHSDRAFINTEQEKQLNMMNLRAQLFQANNKKERETLMWEIVKEACMFNLDDEDKPKFRDLNERYG